MGNRSDSHLKHYSRRTFLSTAMAAPILAAKSGFSTASPRSTGPLAANDLRVSSPDGKITFQLRSAQGRLNYQVSFKNKPVIETSAMGIMIDGIDLCLDGEVGRVESYQVKEQYPWRGVHSQAINHCNGAKVSVKHSKSGTSYSVEVRAFNDGIAFRYVVPGEGNSVRIPDEESAFIIPAESSAWYHDFEGHYEGVHTQKNISEVQAGEWAALPLTIKLPNGVGYAAITEAALIAYSGMGLQADGKRGFKTRLGHALPVSYPFRLRYEADQARLARPAAITGTITTPWRVVMVGSDLNALVNSDIIANLSPPPDKRLFPQGVNTDWLKPGRAVWKYLDGGENTLEEMKNFSRLAGQLGFEYNVVEGFWQRWSEDQIRELVDYSRQQRVGIWFWKHSRDLRTPEGRRKFFKQCNDVGVVGAKIDFFDHEAKEIIDLYQILLKEAAESKLMVAFHGANKPAGEARTWPNEMTREGIYGLEHRKGESWSRHNTTLPFTRMLAGHADYTGMHFGERRRETSWAHQIASVAILTSPVLIYGAHPKNILENPAVEMIKSLPSTWDETIALPMCEIGELAVFARRHGDTWFLAIMNGPNSRKESISLSFLGGGKYEVMLVRDELDNAAAVRIEKTTMNQRDSIKMDLRVGGGFIARFSRSSNAGS